MELNELSRFLTKIDFFPEINVVTSLINHFIQNASDTFCKELCRSLVGESIFQERHCDDGDEKKLCERITKLERWGQFVANYW